MASEQLCWRCKRVGTGTCAWDASKGTVPVEGWTAKEVPYRYGNSQHTTTYEITACPLFDEDEDYYERMRGSVKKPVWKIAGKRLEKMEFRFQCNWTLKAIADEFGISTSAVSNYKRRWREKKKEATK